MDSLSVPGDSVVYNYKLSPSAGRLFVPSSLKDMKGEWEKFTPFGVSFESEDGTLRYVTVATERVNEDTDSTELITRIYEGVRLDDGTWSEPTPVFDEDVDAAYPFMMADGSTFYFASRSEPGLGGYDIFRSYRDSDTGEFRSPVNVGLPYNSNEDDYLLAIDEYTGVGRWATTRTPDEDDRAVIYFYAPSEVRRNYDADTPGIRQLAELWTLNAPEDTPGYTLTWAENKDYSPLRQTLNDIKTEEAAPESENEFFFKADGGKIYTTYSQLPMAARAPMQRYQEALERLEFASAEMAAIRQDFSKNPT
ncbi:MAG: hypothetical protein NC548_66080, partial [Lachnospiraceae bacterium]|nr:hypothetical protein [Lachnospiraceae bacterium]